MTALVTSIAGCGERAGLLDPEAPGDSVFDASGVEHADASLAEAGLGVGPADAGARDVGLGDPDRPRDAAPPAPCHLVPKGDPVRTIAFDPPAYSFHNAGVLARPGSSRVVQYGVVEGIRTGVWDDPPLYAAEYDLSTWPPKAVGAPFQITESTTLPVDFIAGPGGTFGAFWFFDADGNQPFDLRFARLDATSSAPGPIVDAAQHAFAGSRPVITPDRSALVSTYTSWVTADDGATINQARLAFFDRDGKLTRVPLQLATWPARSTQPAPAFSAIATSTDVLVAVSFWACDDAGPYCAPHAIRVIRWSLAGGEHLEPADVVPLADPTKYAMNTQLVGDGAGRTWLLWSEVDAPGDAAPPNESTLFAVPLTPQGGVEGPPERWLVQPLNTNDVTRQPLVGPLGTIYPVAVYVAVDGGSLREVHLLHRQADLTGPLEDVTFTTAYSSYPLSLAPIGSTRTFAVVYSTYPPDSTKGYGEMRRFGCREDVGAGG